VFTLLETKAIDGQENTYSNIFSEKFYEVQPYITESNHGLLDYLVVTSKEFWDKLPSDIRPIVKKDLDEAIVYGNSKAIQLDQEAKEKIIASKRSQIITITPDEREQWVKAMKPVWKKFENEIGKDVIDAAYSSNM